MAIKELITRTTKWFSAKKKGNVYEHLQGPETTELPKNFHNIIPLPRRTDLPERTEALQMIQNSFEQLVQKLGSINENLDRHVAQNAKLMQRIDEIPQLLQNLPEGMKNQKMVVESLIEQLKTQALKNQQFAETIAKIPAASETQTAAIKEMAGQIAASAAVDNQIVEGMRKFNTITDKLKDNVAEQAGSIEQMGKTFSASDRYLKYILNTQHKRFMWVFITAMGVCTFAIIALLIVIFVLK
ncbi:MAG: hypothetical protein A2Y12_03205 [Planctomycetes bacterium GWF2_42_9]|nr:MAG: hypothetical protein A2Y12_03205 [Planctomycetes bacterium GWF2_42_9]HAL44709.1 hypothetical protein [Phycisphaerales bacterium]